MSSEQRRKAKIAETLGLIDTSKVSNELWMVRVPQKLAELYKAAPPGTVLGELVFRKGGKQPNGQTIKPSLSVHVKEELVKEDTSMPIDYTMEAMTKKVPVLHPFSRHPENGRIELHGTVTRTANLQASRDDSRYRQLCKDRLLQTSVNKKSFVKTAEATELSVRKAAPSGAKSAGFGNAVQAFGQRRKDAASQGSLATTDVSRKRKYEETPTRSVLFELFQYRPRWTVKELRQESGKAEKELRQILGEIGTYHRSGEYKNMWSLKEEYAQAQKSDESGKT
jgi:transcription initiation factor TFIIF subunit beta